MDKEKKHIDELLDSYRVPEKRSKQAAWDLLDQKLEEKRKPAGMVRNLSWIISTAAAVVLLALGIMQSGLFAPSMETNIAQDETVWLPDSSKVLLDPNSKLEYDYKLIGGKRNIKLTGEAYFDVEKGKPFSIKFPGGKLKVLGTQFNLSAYAENHIQVDCVSGKVEVEVNNQLILLTKNEGLRFKSGKLSGPYPIKYEDIESRINGIYNWKETDLESIFEYLGLRYNYQFVVQQSQKKRKFTGPVPLSDLNEALDVLSLAMQIEYTIDNNKKLVRIEKR